MRTQSCRIGLFAAASLLLFVPALLAQEKVPRGVLTAATYDFGTVKQGAKLSHTISLRNIGDAPLVIERISSSLPALSVRVKKVIAPGDEATIALELDTAEMSGEVRDDVAIHTNDAQTPPLSFHIQGRVHSPIDVLPRPAIFLSAFRWETETASRSVTIVNNEESLLEILGKRVEGNRFTAELTPTEEGRRYQLTVKLVPGAPAGHGSGQIALSTNRGEIRIPVFTFLKDKVYVNPPEADLGRIDLEQAQKEPKLLEFRSLSIFVYKHRGQDFRIRAEPSLPFIAVEMTPAEGPAAVINIPRQGPTGVFELKVVLIKDQLKPGKFEGTIRVSTNDQEFPHLQIPVRIEVK